MTDRSSSLERLVRRLWPLQAADETTGSHKLESGSGMELRGGEKRRRSSGWSGERRKPRWGRTERTGKDRNAGWGKDMGKTGD